MTHFGGNNDQQIPKLEGVPSSMVPCNDKVRSIEPAWPIFDPVKRLAPKTGCKFKFPPHAGEKKCSSGMLQH